LSNPHGAQEKGGREVETHFVAISLIQRERKRYTPKKRGRKKMATSKIHSYLGKKRER